MKEFELKRARELAAAVDSEDLLHRIGTYNERSQHRTLKFIIEEDKSFHEVPVGAYIADICRDGHIYEIQTVGFKNLVSKLNCFTVDHKVTVVYPAAVAKTVVWIDPSSGETSPGKRFSRRSAKYKLFAELIYIYEFLKNEQIDIMLIETEVNDYRLLDGRGPDRKIKATKSDVVPVDVLKITEIRSTRDLLEIVPLEAGKEYTREEIGKNLQLEGRNLSAAIKTMILLELIEKIKGDKNRVYYKLRAF